MNLTELELAQRIRDGTVPSPMKFSNMWLVNLRITGTGLAYRTGLKEHVWRDPNIYLNDAFCSVVMACRLSPTTLTTLFSPSKILPRE